MGEGCDVNELCAPGFWFDIEGACACVPEKDCGVDCKFPINMGCDYIMMCEPGYTWDMSDDVCACVADKTCDKLEC